jgi:hypothetical protein
MYMVINKFSHENVPFMNVLCKEMFLLGWNSQSNPIDLKSNR